MASRGLKGRPKKPKKTSTRSKNGTKGLVGTGDPKFVHEGMDENAYYKAYKEMPDEAMTRKEHEAWLEEQKRMRQPVNRWNRT